MLASRIQSPRKPVVGRFTDAEFSAMTPAERNAATQAWLDRAQKLEPGTTQNRDWRETCGQGPSYDLLSNRSENNADDFDPRDNDIEPAEAENTTLRTGEGEEGEEASEVVASTVDDAQITIDVVDTGLGFATANPFCTDTRVARGGPARNRDRNAWNAILSLAPSNLPYRDVLVLSAQWGRGESKRIGEVVGLSGRRVRQIQDWLLRWALKNLTAADLRAHRDDPITQEQVARRVPSRAGRKPRRPRLVLVPKMAGPSRTPRPYKPRRPRGRWVDPAQADMFLEVAA